MNVNKRRLEAKKETKPDDASSFYSKLGLDPFLPPQKQGASTSYKIPRLGNKQKSDAQTSRDSNKQSLVAKISKSSSHQTPTANRTRPQTGSLSSTKNTQISTNHTSVSNAASKFDRKDPRDKIQPIKQIPKLGNKQRSDAQTSRNSNKQSIVAKISKSSSHQTPTANRTRPQTGSLSSTKNTQISTKHTSVLNAASKFDRKDPRDKSQPIIQSSNPPKRIAWNSRNETGIPRVSVISRSRGQTAGDITYSLHDQSNKSDQELQATSYSHPNAFLFGFRNNNQQQQQHRDAEIHTTLKQPTIGLHSASNKALQLTNGKADHRRHESSNVLAIDHQTPDVRSQFRPDLNQEVSNIWTSGEYGNQPKVRLSSRELLQKVPHKSVPRTLSTKPKEDDILPEKKIESIENLFPEPVCENDAQRAQILPKLPQEEIDSIVAKSREPIPPSRKSRRTKRTFEVEVDCGVIDRDSDNDSKRPKFSISDPDISEEMEDLAIRLLSGKPLRNIACDIKNEIFEKVRQSQQINSELEFFDHSDSPTPPVMRITTEKNSHLHSRETVGNVQSLRSQSSTDAKCINMKPVKIPIVNLSQSVSTVRPNIVNQDQRRPNMRAATAHDVSKPITRCQLKLEDETVLVHIMERISPMRLMKPVLNTRTPCPSPARDLEMQNLLKHIPYSSASLLQRADIKAKFLSERQAKCPSEQLFKPKAVCEFNLDTVYDFKTNTWKQHKNFGRPLA